jgi:hypothetical protein
MSVRLVAGEPFTTLTNLETRGTYKPVRREVPQRGKEPKVSQVYTLELKPHSYLVLRTENR